DRRSDSQLLQPLRDFPPKQIADVYLCKTQVSMFVPLDMVQASQIMLVEDLDQSFRQNDDPVGSPPVKPFDDGADHQIDKTFELPRAFAKFFGNERQRRTGGFSNPECQVSGLASHGHGEIPPRGGTRIHHQILDDLDPEMAGGLKSEGGNPLRQIEVVVDRFGDMDDLEMTG